MNAKLTAKETALMTAIANRYFSFFDDGLVAGSGIWTNTMTEEIVGNKDYPVSDTLRGAASVINSLSRKGLIAQTTSEEDGAWVELTEDGAAWCEANATVPAAAEEAPATAAPAPAEEATEGDLPAIGETLKYKDGKDYTFVSLSKDKLCYRVKDAEGKASYKRIGSFV